MTISVRPTVQSNADNAQSSRPPFSSVDCEGTYRHHLQGICTNEVDAIYWSFTTTLVKTDRDGNVRTKVEVPRHYGDLCFCDGAIHVAVNFGRFNDPEGNADNWVYVHDADDLELLSKHESSEVFYGAGGVACHNSKFIVIGGLPEGVEENYLYEYDKDYKLANKHVLNSGYTRLGIQTATFAAGLWWFGCYGSKLLTTDESFNLIGKYDFDCALGVVGISGGTFLIGRGGGEGHQRTGKALLADVDEEAGLTIRSVAKL